MLLNMKKFLIKTGKALKIIQREGIFCGGKRIVNFILHFFQMMKKLPGGDVIFVTNGIGDSALYRTVHVSEELNLKGIRSFVTVEESPYLLGYADSFKVFVFHRTLHSPKMEKLIEKIKEQGKEIIFETDDLVFDSRYFKGVDYLENINTLERKQFEKGIGEEILNNSYVKVCTTTTLYLAEKLKEYGKEVFIVPNRLSQNDLKMAENVLKSGNKTDDGKIRLGYFSGTISHNKDFAVISNVLMEIMEKHQNVELFLVGPLDIESKLNKFRERIKQLPYVPRKKHFENISKVDINLAPLEIGNPFCEAKSELKFFEAGIVGIPTVASATQTFKEAISDGINGFVASDTEEWKNKLERLILSPELRSRMGQEARKKALEKYSTQSGDNEEYYAYLRSKIVLSQTSK